MSKENQKINNGKRDKPKVVTNFNLDKEEEEALKAAREKIDFSPHLAEDDDDDDY